MSIEEEISEIVSKSFTVPGMADDRRNHMESEMAAYVRAKVLAALEEVRAAYPEQFVRREIEPMSFEDGQDFARLKFVGAIDAAVERLCGTPPRPGA